MPYVDGVDGVTAQLNAGGALSLLMVSGRTVDIGEIRNSGGALLVDSLPGEVAAHLQTKGCCDLWGMTTGETMPIKLSVKWFTGDADSFYVISMGATTNCIVEGSPPEHFGTLAQATRTSETSWTIASVGPAALCHFIDKKGKKNDELVLSPDVVVDMVLNFST